MNQQSADAIGTICARPMAGGEACLADEMVGVRSIKVVHRRLRATVIVGSFFVVDKLLEWAVRLKGVLDCEFEIVYHDGRTISGAYRSRRKGASRPALMHFVRASLQARCEEAASACAVTGLGSNTQVFMRVPNGHEFGSCTY